MWDSVRSTWPVDGPGSDSFPLGSRDNTSALSATIAPLWSSNLAGHSSRCPLGSIQSHLALDCRLWSLACRCILWGNKANCLCGPTSPIGIPSFFGFKPWFYFFASYESFENSLSLCSEAIHEIPLGNFCEQTCWLFSHSPGPFLTHRTKNATHLSAGRFSCGLQRLPLVLFLLFRVMWSFAFVYIFLTVGDLKENYPIILEH